MNIKVIILNLSVISLLTSCAGIGIPNSSDPYEKLKYSYQAMNMNRYIPANRLIVGAIKIFKERKDKEGLAEAYATYGNYYKFGFPDRGPLIKYSNTKNSVKYFKLSADLYKEIGDVNGVAKTYMGMGSALVGTDNKKACEHYQKSIDTFDPKGKLFLINPAFKSFPEMVEHFKDKYCK